MTKKDLIGIFEGLQELLKLTMHESIDAVWKNSEEELIELFEDVLATANDEHRPGLFTLMQTAGLIGSVLVIKHGKDEDELMKILKNSNAIFVKEILNE